MPDELHFDRPVLVLDRKGNVIEDNMREFLEWRTRADPESYDAAMNELAGIVADAAARKLIEEDAEQKRISRGFAEACRMRMLAERR